MIFGSKNRAQLTQCLLDLLHQHGLQAQPRHLHLSCGVPFGFPEHHPRAIRSRHRHQGTDGNGVCWHSSGASVPRISWATCVPGWARLGIAGHSWAWVKMDTLKIDENWMVNGWELVLKSTFFSETKQFCTKIVFFFIPCCLYLVWLLVRLIIYCYWLEISGPLVSASFLMDEYTPGWFILAVSYSIAVVFPMCLWWWHGLTMPIPLKKWHRSQIASSAPNIPKLSIYVFHGFVLGKTWKNCNHHSPDHFKWNLEQCVGRGVRHGHRIVFQVRRVHCNDNILASVQPRWIRWIEDGNINHFCKGDKCDDKGKEKVNQVNNLVLQEVIDSDSLSVPIQGCMALRAKVSVASIAQNLECKTVAALCRYHPI